MNKDESLDRMLERTARARADARPQGACLDPEALAAWMDGSLTARERAAVETHAADCDRCLAMLAAIAKTIPPPAAAQRRPWLAVRWLVPLATAAVAVTVWVFVPEPQPAPSPVPPAPTAAVPELKPAEPVVLAERNANARNRTDALKKKAEAPSAVASPSAQSPSRSEAKEERFRILAESVQAPRAIVSPDPNMRWRVTGPSVERSTDGGRTWRTQPTGTSLDLLAGSSPSPTVCWIVGRSGLVLVSTDGESWRRLVFPDSAVDLVNVTARDGLAATVTAANGRTYRTSDAGRTWILQEDPSTPF